MRGMRRSWNKGLVTVGLQVVVTLILSGCHTVVGAVDDFGRQFTVLAGLVRPEPSKSEINDIVTKAGTTIDVRAGAIAVSQRAKRLLWPKTGEPSSSSTSSSNPGLERAETPPEEPGSRTGQEGSKIDVAAEASTTSLKADTRPYFRVQVAAVRDEADADKAWERAQSEHGAVLAGMEPHVVRAKSSKGIIYRIQTGPFRTRSAADRFCGRLEERGAICIVVAA